MRKNQRAFSRTSQLGSGSAIRPAAAIAMLALAAVASMPKTSLADEGGVSFWLPGFFGSLAATPQQPGWSLVSMYYHTSVSAGGDVAFARERTLNRTPGNLSLNASLTGSVSSRADLEFMALTYVLPTPVLGG